jgi:predicted ATPase
MMFYQLFEYSKERKKKFPLSKSTVLVLSSTEKNFTSAIKRLKKVDPNIVELCTVQEQPPKFNVEDCVMFPGSQEDIETFYKQ